MSNLSNNNNFVSAQISLPVDSKPRISMNSKLIEIFQRLVQNLNISVFQG